MPPPPSETMGERVVLIHAAVADSRMWERQARGLQARGFDVVTPDLPGFGSEPVPAGPFSFVERIASLLPTMLVGSSFSGRIALETALAQPLSALRPPTLGVLGENDRPDFAAIAERIVREAPNARLEVVPGARHLPSLERPDEFDALVVPFLS